MSGKLGRNPFQKKKPPVPAPAPVSKDEVAKAEGVPVTVPRLDVEFPSITLLGKALLWSAVDLPRRLRGVTSGRG